MLISLTIDKGLVGISIQLDFSEMPAKTKNLASAREQAIKRKRSEDKKIANKILLNEAMLILNPLATFEGELIFSNKDSTEFTTTYSTAPTMDETHLDWAFDLTKSNMKEMYENSEWKWFDNTKKSELLDKSARYLVVKVGDIPVAFTHFRYVVENSDAVVYCYELQVDKEFQGQGIGKRLMGVLEWISKLTKLGKVMLTVLHANEGAVRFYESLGYKKDKFSPCYVKNDTKNCLSKAELCASDYVILSKKFDF